MSNKSSVVDVCYRDRSIFPKRTLRGGPSVIYAVLKLAFWSTRTSLTQLRARALPLNRRVNHFAQRTVLRNASFLPYALLNILKFVALPVVTKTDRKTDVCPREISSPRLTTVERKGRRLFNCIHRYVFHLSTFISLMSQIFSLHAK